jgi:hypothetical protein
MNKERLLEALDVLELETSETMAEQLAICVRALRIFEEHTAEIGEIWREVEARQNAHLIKHKADRLYHAAVDGRSSERMSNFSIDSALDLVNYACFFARQLEATMGSPEHSPPPGRG